MSGVRLAIEGIERVKALDQIGVVALLFGDKSHVECVDGKTCIPAAGKTIRREIPSRRKTSVDITAGFFRKRGSLCKVFGL